MLTLPHLWPGVGTPSGWLLAAFWRDRSSPVTSWFLTQVCGQTLPISFHTPKVSCLSKNFNVFSRKLHEFKLVLLMVKDWGSQSLEVILLSIQVMLLSWFMVRFIRFSFSSVSKSYKNIPWLQRQSFISRGLQRRLLHAAPTRSAQWHA